MNFGLNRFYWAMFDINLSGTNKQTNALLTYVDELIGKVLKQETFFGSLCLLNSFEERQLLYINSPKNLRKMFFWEKLALMFEYICGYILISSYKYACWFLTTRDETFVKALNGDWNQDEINFAQRSVKYFPSLSLLLL